MWLSLLSSFFFLSMALKWCYVLFIWGFSLWQVICEFVNVTRWKIAICGEFMKTRYQVLKFFHFFIFKTNYLRWSSCHRAVIDGFVASSQTCSHGTACNFIHCFRNPGGDYEWADSDKPPPRYWVKKMASLFGYLDESENEKHTELEHWDKFGKSSRSMSTDVDRYSRGVTMI